MAAGAAVTTRMSAWATRMARVDGQSSRIPSSYRSVSRSRFARNAIKIGTIIAALAAAACQPTWLHHDAGLRAPTQKRVSSWIRLLCSALICLLMATSRETLRRRSRSKDGCPSARKNLNHEDDAKVLANKDRRQQNLVIVALALAYGVLDLTKVNMSVGVIPISEEFRLSEADIGVASSAFFWGYMATQLPAVWLAGNWGPAVVLFVGIFITSVGTLLTLMLATVAVSPSAVVSFLACCRLLVGLGQGLVPASIGSLLGQLPRERLSFATGVAFAGYSGGSALGLLVCPVVAATFGWPVVFWAPALVGFAWCATWPAIAAQSQDPAKKDQAARTKGASVPWKQILQNRGVWILIVSHALSNIAFYALLTWMPTWYSKDLGLSLEKVGVFSFAPYFGNALLSPMVGQFADQLRKGGMTTQKVRRIFQGLAFFGPAVCMAVLATFGSTLGVFSQFVLASMPMVLHSFGRAGMLCTHADLSPRHAGTLVALSTTAGSLSPLVCVWAIGALVEQIGSLRIGLFVPICVVQTIGGVLYCSSSVNERQDFDDL